MKRRVIYDYRFIFCEDSCVAKTNLHAIFSPPFDFIFYSFYLFPRNKSIIMVYAAVIKNTYEFPKVKPIQYGKNDKRYSDDGASCPYLQIKFQKLAPYDCSVNYGR